MPQEFEFDEFRICFEPDGLWRSGELVSLRKKEFATLRALVEARGEPVSAEDLIAKIWDGASYLDRSNLRHQILSLRQKLDKGPNYIVSSRGAGYRLAATVVPYVPARRQAGAEPDPDLVRPAASFLRKFAGRNVRILGIAVLAAATALAVLTSIAWRFWPDDIQLRNCRQLTRDGRPKGGPILSDGSRVYFTEDVGRNRVIASVPLRGVMSLRSICRSALHNC